MVAFPLLLAFIGAVGVLCLIPGPNVALIVSNSVAYGARYGLMTVVGTSAAMIPMLVVTGLGMTALLGGLATWFSWLRWLGVIYLVWLGVQHWRAAPLDLRLAQPPRQSAGFILLRAFLVSITNPKTLLFYGAFFPQFVSGERPLGPQVATLSVTFVLVAMLVDGMWAILAARLRGLLAVRGRLRNRLTGGLLIGAGLGLAAARRS